MGFTVAFNMFSNKNDIHIHTPYKCMNIFRF